MRLSKLPLLFVASLLYAQTFEAVNISQTSDSTPTNFHISSGYERYVAQGISVQQLLQISLVSKMESVRLDHVVGKLPPGKWNLSAVTPTDHKMVNSNGSAKPEFYLMLLHALEQEFGLTLTVHLEEEDACVLEVAPGGLKIKKSPNQTAPFIDLSKVDMTTFSYHTAYRNVLGDALVKSGLGSQRCVNLGLARVSELPIDPETKYDLNMTYVDRDFAERVGRSAEANVAGPDKVAAMKDQAGVLLVVKKRPIPYYYFEWSGKLPQK